MPGSTRSRNYLPVFVGEYSCLRVDLVFARELSFYIVTIYVPCFMIVSSVKRRILSHDTWHTDK